MIINEKRPIAHTFRIGTDLYEQLEMESRKKNISINVLLNQIIREHIFKANFDKIDSFLIPKDVIRSMLELIDEKYIVELARKIGSYNAVEYVRLIYGDTNKDTIIRFLEMWSSRFSGYEYKNHGSLHWFSVQHSISEKYSIFMAEFIKSLVASTMKEPIKVQTSQRTVMFHLAL